MFKYPIFQDYTLADATGEILTMLLVAFLLGMLLQYFLQRHCKCTSGEKKETKSTEPDDLKVIEGIGPKIEQLLNADGIMSWYDLATAPTDKVQGILDRAGNRFRMHDPKTWAEQAKLADAGKWDELKEYQDYLDGGRG